MAKPKDTDIPIGFLRECFDLDVETGVLTWRVRPREHFSTASSWKMRNKRFAGKQTGAPLQKGYPRLNVFLDGRHRLLLPHRIIFALTHERWPAEELDHRNGVRSDMRPGNLREATKAQNQHNRKISRNNTSGFHGVDWHKATGKWRARISSGNKSIALGHFDTPEAAYAAYLKAKAEFHPFQPIPR